MRYLVKTPWWLKFMVPGAIWSMPKTGKKLYLSFDDGPHPDITPWVLDLLRKYQAKATFFCVGNNVVQYPDVYNRIIQEGHVVGNHTFQHLNGWKTGDKAYMDDVAHAAEYIKSRLFRPPYGKIGMFQRFLLQKKKFEMRIVMWSVLSADFDTRISGKQCLEHVLLHAGDGDIVVFHDSEKARERMEYALPAVLEYYHAKGFQFDVIHGDRP